jgi:hypothetical protein
MQRTLQFLGQGWGSSPVSVTATINGSTVYTGNIDTKVKPAGWYALPYTDQVVLFTVDFDDTRYDNDGNPTWAGATDDPPTPAETISFPMTISVTGGDGFTFGQVNISQNADQTTFIYCYSNTDLDGECRLEVTLDGEAVTPPGPRPSTEDGAWFWNVAESIQFDLRIS